jgi:hypothetical protein
MKRRQTHPSPKSRTRHLLCNDDDDGDYDGCGDGQHGRDTFDTFHDVDASKEMLVRGAMLSESVTTNSSQGGRLWGPLLSTPNFMLSGDRRFGEGMFDSFGDDETGANQYLQAALLAQEYGYLSSSAVEDVISLYNSEELLRLRNDIIEQLSGSGPPSPIRERERPSPSNPKHGKAFALSEMTAIKQAASYFVNSLVSSVVVGITADFSYDDADFLSADDIMSMSMSSQVSNGTERSGMSSGRSFTRSTCKSIYDIKDLQSHYSSYIQSSDETKPNIRVEVLGESVNTRDSYQPTCSDEISLSSIHNTVVDFSSSLSEHPSPLQSKGLPVREMKKLRHDKVVGAKVKVDSIGGGSSDRHSLSPIRHRISPENVSVEGAAVTTESQRLASPLRVMSASAYRDSSETLAIDMYKPGSPTNMAVLSDFPHRPKSHQASRYGGASKHRVLVASNVDNKSGDAECDSDHEGLRASAVGGRPGISSEENGGGAMIASAMVKCDVDVSTRNSRGLLYVSGGDTFVHPTINGPGLDRVHTLQSYKDDTGADMTQDSIVVVKDVPEPILPRPRGPTDLVIKGSEAMTAPVRGNMWRGRYVAHSDGKSGLNQEGSAAAGTEKKGKSELVLSFPFLQEEEPSTDCVESVFEGMSDSDEDGADSSYPNGVSAGGSLFSVASSKRDPERTNRGRGSLSGAGSPDANTMLLLELDSASGLQKNRGFGPAPLVPPSPTRTRPYSHNSPSRVPLNTTMHILKGGDREYVDVARPISRAQTTLQRDKRNGKIHQDQRQGSGVRNDSECARSAPRTLEDIYKASASGSLRPNKPSSASSSITPGLHQYSRVAESSRAKTSQGNGQETSYSQQMLANPHGYVPRPPPQQKHVSHMRDVTGRGRNFAKRK